MLYKAGAQHLYGVERRRITMPENTFLRLNRLERVHTDPMIVRDIWDTATGNEISLYPDYNVFYERLAAFIGRKREEIVVGSGIEEFIKTLYWLTCNPGERVTILSPTCAMFEVYADVFQIRLDRVITDPENPPTIDAVISAISPETRLCLLANPGQPVETLYGVDDLRELARACDTNGTVLAIDEAYHGFGAPTAMELVDEFDNVLILRTFSKAFGAAGIRIGYAVGQHRVLKPLDAMRSSGEATGPSMHVASVLMEDYDWLVDDALRDVCVGRNWLRDTVALRHGLKTYGAHANHVLIDLESTERRDLVVQRLADKGVLVKSGYESPVNRHILVTAADLSIMYGFAAHLKAALEG